jgi:hypothetical protein
MWMQQASHKGEEVSSNLTTGTKLGYVSSEPAERDDETVRSKLLIGAFVGCFHEADTFRFESDISLYITGRFMFDRT